jgi:hypothetical protein
MEKIKCKKSHNGNLGIQGFFTTFGKASWLCLGSDRPFPGRPLYFMFTYPTLFILPGFPPLSLPDVRLPSGLSFCVVV